MIAFALQIAPHRPDPVAVLRALEATAKARVEAGTAHLLAPDLVARYRTEVARLCSVQGTTHISVIDAEGMGAAMTLSNGAGSGLIAPGTGIMPNNMLGEADLLPQGLQSWTPRHRMASMMSPLAVEWRDGRVALMGSGGSNRIRTALAQVLLQLLDFDMHLAPAIDLPRVHAEVSKTVDVDFEDLSGEAVRDAILAAFPEATPWSERSMFFGGVHAVLGDGRGGLDAAGDPRRAGVACMG